MECGTDWTMVIVVTSIIVGGLIIAVGMVLGTWLYGLRRIEKKWKI